jgi:hypothetical protein
MIARRSISVALLAMFALGTTTPTMAVACEGGGEGPGDLIAKPSSLDFGEVEVGKSETLSDTFEELFVEVAIKEVENFTAPTYTLAKDGCKGMKLKATGTCTIEVKFEPKFQGDATGNEWPLEMPSGMMLANLGLTGIGKNVVKIAPSKLTWAPKEKGPTAVKGFMVKTLTEIEITKLETNDPADFAIHQVSGCKEKTKIKSSTPCEVFIERTTETKTGEKLFKWKYKEEDGTIKNGEEGVIEGQ